MVRTVTSLNEFFPIKNVSDKRLSQLTKTKEFNLVKEKILKKMQGMPLPDGFFEQMLRQFSDLLNVDVRAILISAWGRSKEIVKYHDKNKYPPNEINFVHLAEHSIKSEHQPSLKPYINKVALGEIKFKVNLELKLKGAILKIQNARIMEASLGSCEGNGSVKYGNYAIIEKELQKLVLPGKVELGEGIPIGSQVAKVHNFIDTIYKLAS